MSARTIVVGYDRSAGAKAAARWALDEAARTGAPVEFLYAFAWPVWAPAASMVPAPSVWPDSETELAVKQSLADAVAAAAESHPGVRTSFVTVTNEAALALIGRSADAGVIVLGSPGHGAIVNLLGSVGVAVSAHARCPVVIVRGRPGAGKPVVVGFDDSQPSRPALSFAAEQAVARGVPLRVISAGKPLRRQPFDAVRTQYPGLEVRVEAVDAEPGAALTAAAADAQLLVVGSRGRGALRGALLGSVSQHLLRHAPGNLAIAHEAHSHQETRGPQPPRDTRPTATKRHEAGSR